MVTFLGIYFIVLTGVLVFLMLRDHQIGQCELVSVRNVALIGFIIFQLTSASTTLLTDDWAQYALSEKTKTATEYALMCTVFIIVALWAYRRGWFVNKLASKLPSTKADPGDGALLAMALVTTFLAVVMRFTIRVPVIGAASVEIAAGLGAVACGMVGWVWARRLFNPAVIIYVAFIFAVNLGAVMYGSFGRRGLVAMGACLLWGMYYSHWRYQRLGTFLMRLALVGVGPLIVLSLFTSVRSAAETSRSTTEHVQAIVSGGEVATGLLDLLGGQRTAAGSMWLVESYNQDDVETRHLFTIRNFFYYPVPSMFWEDKPLPLSKLIPHMAHLIGVNRNLLTIGPGIIGSAAAEGGWYALLIYAVVSGLFLRFFDQAIRFNPYSPFFVIPIGASLGQILGLARGETSAFAFLACLSVGGTLIFMVAIGKVVEKFGPRFAAAPDASSDGDWPETDDTSDEQYAYLQTGEEAGPTR